MKTDYEVSNRSPGSEDSSASLGLKPASGLYVDIENLRAYGKQIVMSLLESWPTVAPVPKLLCLYVKADLVELWRLWATSQFRSLTVVVKGVQHFSTSPSKNSADMALATDAISDLLLGRVGYVVVVSDDSDFMVLYAKVRDEMARSQPEVGRVPFLWVVTDRTDTLSATVREYFPSDYVHTVQCQDVGSVVPIKSAVASPAKTSDTDRNEPPTGEAFARAIIEHIPVGTFKAADVQQIIKQLWPSHSLATAGGPAFGTEFMKNIWPFLERRGAEVANPGRKPRRYNMTEKAKGAGL